MHSRTDRLSGQSACSTTKHTTTMELNTAKQVIAEALHIAIAKGCYGLVEVQNIVKALETINEMPAIEFGEVEEE